MSQEFENFFKAWIQADMGGEINALLRYLDNLDSKSSALLTHVSIMMAVSILIFDPNAGSTYINVFIAAEAIGYMLVAIGCIISIWIIAPFRSDPNPNNLVKDVKKALRFRHRIYKVSLLCAFALTVALIATFIAKIS